MQHVVRNNVAICCVGMFRSFGLGFRRWMVSGPKLAGMLEEFKGNTSTAKDHHHYGQKHGF